MQIGKKYFSLSGYSKFFKDSRIDIIKLNLAAKRLMVFYLPPSPGK